MQIEMVRVETIREYERNPREISDQAIAAVARSIEAFGFKVPIIVDADSTIIAGHTRLRAARKLGLEAVPVIRAADLTPEQVKAFRLADNQVAALSKWDYELLPLELSELQGAGVDLSLLAFDQDELAKLLDPGVKQGLTDPDEVPEPPDEAVTQPGDLWILGDHRLLCGDAGGTVDVDCLLAADPQPLPPKGQAVIVPSGVSVQYLSPPLLPIHLVNTDPPYNVRLMYRVAA